MIEHVDVDPQQVSNGTAEWEAASSALAARFQAAMSRIQALNSARPWGADGPGSAFAGAYEKDGGPEKVLFAGGKAIVNEVVELGPNIAKAVGHSMAADEQQAREMSNAAKELGDR